MPDSTGRRQELERMTAAYERRMERGTENRYSLFSPGHMYHSQSLERAVVRALRKEGIATLGGLRILDVGCGGASWLDGLTRFGASPQNLYGIDTRVSALPREASRPSLAVASGYALPFATASFDLVSQLTMVSSILDAGERRLVAAEMVRVVRSGGLILWYDFTVNPMNPDVRGIGRRELLSLFASSRVRSERVTLAPPITRYLAPRSWAACLLLEQLPFLRTHLLATIRPVPRGQDRQS